MERHSEQHDGGSETEQPNSPLSDETLSRFAIRWGILLLLLVAAFACTVIALNSTLYSARGFVGEYLDALARHDVRSALATPGVVIPDVGTRALLADDVLGTLTDVRLRSDTDARGGARHLVYTMRLDGIASDAAFDVRRGPDRLVFFSSWEFVASPASTLAITPVSDADFEVNGVAVTSAKGAGVAAVYPVLTPAVFSLSHSSQYLVAAPQRVIVASPGGQVQASVTSIANPSFVKLVQKELTATLRECTKQTVLQPSGCPFGKAIDNRVEGLPIWTMASYPTISIVAGPTPGTWLVPSTRGAAHLRVGVQSLFDGSESVFDEDVPFDVAYRIVIAADGRLDITAE